MILIKFFCGRIIMNEKFKKEGRKLTISHMTTCRIPNKNIGKPRKMKKVFSINNKKKKKE